MPQGVIPDLGLVTNGPNTQGFRQAQERLTAALGVVVSFLTPTEAVYPDGTALDDNGRPFDPVIQPVSGGDPVGVDIRVTPVLRQIGTGDDIIEGPSGLRQDETPAFIVMEADYPSIQGATLVDWDGQRYAINEMRHDGYRYLVFTESM